MERSTAWSGRRLRWSVGKLGPMDSRSGQTRRDLDDWFDEPDPPRRPSRASVQADPDAPTREKTTPTPDDWRAPKSPWRSRRLPRSAPARNRRLLVAVGIALTALLISLALGGVLSGGNNKSANNPPTPTTPTTTRSPTPATPLLPAATVKPGDHSNAVKALQRALRSLGYTVGTIDGVFGTSTQNALITFQTAHHLTPDGILGPATRTALLNALRPG
jgi:putative peptidoglycan binding protein